MPGDFRDARVVVMGLGRFGGGVGAVRRLADQGADVLVTDREPAERLAEPIGAIQDLVNAGKIRLRLGGHDEADFRDADLVVVSPAVPKPWENKFVLAAADAGARLSTEIRLLVERLPDRSRVVGVTGSAGKSTTAAMIAHILRTIAGDGGRDAGATESGVARLSEPCTHGRDARATGGGGGRVWLGGNIGGSLLPRVDEITPADRVVLELSSAMLYWLGDWFVGRRDEQGWTPGVAVITNVTPNHIDWHGGFEHYARCKNNIIDCVGAKQRVLHGADVLDADLDAPAVKRTPLVGSHNRRNAAVAARAAVAALGPRGEELDADTIARAVATFTGLPHRLQLVAHTDPGWHGSPSRYAGWHGSASRDRAGETPVPLQQGPQGSPSHVGNVVRAYNDSKCTTPEAAALAILAFEGTINPIQSGTGVPPVRENSGTGVPPVHDKTDTTFLASRADPAPAPASELIPVHLIAGGSDKGVDLSPMVGPAARCLGVWTIGSTGPTLARMIRDAGGRAIDAGTLEDAVRGILTQIAPGQAVLLSPGCASLDQFRDYEDRGRRFTALVRAGLGLSPAVGSLFETPPAVVPEQIPTENNPNAA